MRYFCLLSIFLPFFSFAITPLDKYLKQDEMLNNISKTYLEKYGTKINTKAINHLFQKSKIYDNEHIYISGNFKSLKNFQKHILQATSWRIMKYSHYGLYTKDNNYFAILLKRYLFLKQIGFQKNDVFIISGETDPGVKSVMAYFQNLKGEVFHVLPSIKANSFFQFKFSKQIEETSPAFELVVETIFDGRRVANIIRKNNVLTANLKINYPHPKDAENYLLKKIKPSGKVYEKDVVYFINLLQIIVIILGFALFGKELLR